MDEMKISYKKLKNFVNKLQFKGNEEISMTFIIASLFPEAEKNLRNNFKKIFQEGYAQALKDINESKQKEE